MKIDDVLKVQSCSGEQWRMFAFIVRFLKSNNIDFYVDSGNIYATKGSADSYPCIVAHMDTVHPIVEDLHILNFNGNLTGFNRATMQQTGIGGDDKVGIYIALECLDKLDYLKVAFFRDEETGCDGSAEADMSFFSDCRFVLQCDRRGNSDFIVNASGIELSGTDFQFDVMPITEKYGYQFANGAMTDVMQLKCDGLNIACANISCGYYRPHSEDEYVNLNDVSNCLNMVIDICTHLTGTYEHTYVRTFTGKYYSYGRCLFDDLEPIKTIHATDTKLCTVCGSHNTEVDYYDSSYYCHSCMSFFK